MVPIAVRKAAEEADEALAGFEKAREDNDAGATSLLAIGEDGEVVDPTDAEDVDEVVVDPADVDDTGSDADAPVDFEQKYNTLQGKYNAEIPRLQTQIVDLGSRLTDVLSTPPVPAEPEIPEGPAHARYLEEEELGEYGEDILDMQGRMAKGVAEGVIESRLQPLLNRIDYLESMVLSNSSQGFWSQVEQEIPGARQINDNDQGWFEFLETVEPHSGVQYKELGERAYNENNVSRMVTILQAYGAGSQDAPAKKKKKSPPVKPGKVASSKSVSSKGAAKPMFKESEVEQFYDDKARGKYRGRDELADAREKAIDEAFDEGRIVAG